MSNLGTSAILLVLAILLLWLAVTDRLSRLLDAWDVATGKATASLSTGNTVADASKVAASVGQVALSLPALPQLGHTANVGI